MEPTRPAELTVVAADHPSLDDAVHAFATALLSEPRYFGRRGHQAARPTPRLVRRLITPSSNLRLATLIEGEIVAMAAIDGDALDGPELLIAVASPWRGQGLALAIGRAIVARATDHGLERVVLRTNYRSSDVREAGHALGLEAIDLGQGRLALVRRLERRTA